MHLSEHNLYIRLLRILQDLRDRTYYLSNGVIRVGGRRVATNAAAFTKGDIVGVVLDADQGEIVFLRNGIEQGRARGIRGRLYPFVSFDSEQDQITLLGELSVTTFLSCKLLELCWLFMLWKVASLWRVVISALQGKVVMLAISQFSVCLADLSCNSILQDRTRCH
jgi:hypothetical protein